MATDGNGADRRTDLTIRASNSPTPYLPPSPTRSLNGESSSPFIPTPNGDRSPRSDPKVNKKKNQKNIP